MTTPLPRKEVFENVNLVSTSSSRFSGTDTEGPISFDINEYFQFTDLLTPNINYYDMTYGV